ncbi:MAG: hypothetical protein EBS86_06405 [Crocinitomicaceae bacterium]|jgi:hypothetical protein|nr:hypothetical protein [Crocinitomicaceae bacterium]
MDEFDKLKILEEIHYLRCSIKNRQHLLEQADKTEKFRIHHRNMIDFEMKKIIELENKLKRG